VALQQTPRTDLRLRPENVFALQRSAIVEDDLLCIDDLPSDVTFPPPGAKFALVDHNSLSSRFSTVHTTQEGQTAEPTRVVGIIDHHEDEHSHSDAPLRVIQVPTGSCASLVTNHFRSVSTPSSPPVPPELASLLLSAILIDTNGFEGSRGQPADHAAASYLLPLTKQGAAPDLAKDAAILNLTRLLNEKKFDVDSLGARDLLRRDYKEYSIPRGDVHVKVGLATVPLGLQRIFELSSARKPDGAEEPAEFWEGVDAWMAEQSLDVLGVLCSFRAPKKGKKGKADSDDAPAVTKTGKPAGKHRRQILVVVRGGTTSNDLVEILFSGLDAATELENEVVSISDLLPSLKKGKGKGKGKAKAFNETRSNGSRVRAWDQRNDEPSRKAIAPLFKSIISAKPASDPPQE